MSGPSERRRQYPPRSRDRAEPHPARPSRRREGHAGRAHHRGLRPPVHLDRGHAPRGREDGDRARPRGQGLHGQGRARARRGHHRRDPREGRGRRGRRRLHPRRLPPHDRAGRGARRRVRQARPLADGGAPARGARRGARAPAVGSPGLPGRAPVPRRLQPAEGRGQVRRRRLRPHPARRRQARGRPQPARGLPPVDLAARRVLRGRAGSCGASTARGRPPRSTTTSGRRSPRCASRTSSDHQEESQRRSTRWLRPARSSCGR